MRMHPDDKQIPDDVFTMVEQSRDPVATAVSIMGMMSAIVELKSGTASVVRLLQEISEGIERSQKP